MELANALPSSNAADQPVELPVCRCGHCRTVIDIVGKHRRAHCPECGRSNAIPNRVYVTCERCGCGQRIPFSRRHDPPLCANCGYSFHLREVELIQQHRHMHVHGGHGHVHRSDGAAFTILLYAAALILFLSWLIQR